MPRCQWTPEKLETLRKNYAEADNDELARELGCSRKVMIVYAGRLGLKKSEAANARRYAKMARANSDALREEMSLAVRRRVATGLVIEEPGKLIHYGE